MRITLDGLSILRSLGVKFSVDWDGELAIEVSQDVSKDTLLKVAECLREPIRRRLEGERWARTQSFVGGPFSGKIHGYGGYTGRKGYKICRAKWAVYSFQENGRALFKGYATSEQKARRGILVKQ